MVTLRIADIEHHRNIPSTAVVESIP